MSKDEPEEILKGKSEAKAGTEREETLQEVMASGGFFNSPLFWGLLIFIPIALSLFISVKNSPKEAPAVEVSAKEMSDKAAVKKAPDKPRRGPRGRARRGAR